jgi:hypothetical protein
VIGRVILVIVLDLLSGSPDIHYNIVPCNPKTHRIEKLRGVSLFKSTFKGGVK